MSVLNWEVNSSSIFAPFLILMTHYSPVNLKLLHFQLWTKESHQNPNFETSKCSDEYFSNSSWHFWKQKSVFLQILHHSLVSWKITLLDLFRSNISGKDKSKCKFLGLLSARIRIHQILVIFETTDQFCFKFFLTNLEYHQHNFSALPKLKHYILWSKADY